MYINYIKYILPLLVVFSNSVYSIEIFKKKSNNLYDNIHLIEREQMDFNKISLPNKSSIYWHNSSDKSPLFYLTISFGNGLNIFNDKEKTAFHFFLQLLNLNLVTRTHPICVNDGSDNLEINYFYTTENKVYFQFIGLNKNLDYHLQYINCIFDNPQYFEENLSYYIKNWKNNISDKINLNDSSLIQDLINEEISYLSYNKFYNLNNAKKLDGVKIKDITKIHDKVVHANGLKLVYISTTEKDQLPVIKKFLNKLPQGNIYPELYSESNELQKKSEKFDVYILQNRDFKQNYITISQNFSDNYNFSKADNIHLDIISSDFKNNIFFPKIRSETGISYNPYTILNDSEFSLVYESPKNEVFNSINISLELLDNYIKTGISSENLINTKKSIIHSEAKKEFTNSDYLKLITGKVSSNLIPNIDVTDYLLYIKNINDLNKINNTLNSFFKREKYSIIYIIGDPNIEELNRLKNHPRIQSVNLSTKEYFIEEYKKRK
ncbi:hypothetical protein QEJ31_05160 [Pigmentibacter sp. JX0631]|uniref:hypothetical protein n=1 Tax=Pigmentibacter sp. JX0631 TaxID=2976982 RepID=UPI0024686073|nr:hypothetical protein [Pigmentibacter sp. JX0631]WGL60985.1 hypothetical protein QEJ31_05160 [Pigmentibacter sp. JX0631]